jgi:hypothetical protein
MHVVCHAHTRERPAWKKEIGTDFKISRMALATGWHHHANTAHLIEQLGSIQFKGAFILEIAGGSDAKIVLEGARRANHFLREITRQQDISTKKGTAG